MADSVESVPFKREGHVHHLDDKDTLVVEALADIGDEGVGVVEVVEHADGRDRLGLSLPEGSGPRALAEEIDDDFRRSFLAVFVKVARRFEAHRVQPGNFVTAQQGAVVCADVDNEIAGLQVGGIRSIGSDVCQFVGHRLVDSGAIPVISVHGLTRYRMPKLEQAASALLGIAQNQFKRCLDAWFGHRIIDKVGNREVAER